ncbi:hypothetical protein SAMN04487977_101190 [Treponema bryantii]|uniref:Uncharacterized protein n=1 Tax=Treponema bryantii TaxID=163 RepID=A0A1H9A3R1_9SPIR|nr:hypothetical protein [Treponema bryantii]SEP71151.1 hypothetical protein SAMN04487977_101190 [Treponema bryantii]
MEKEIKNESEKTFFTNIGDFIKKVGEYSDGLKVLWSAIVIVSVFLVFYYEDEYLKFFGISLTSIDFDWKYIVYKAVTNIIIYSALFFVYIFSEYLFIWADCIKETLKNGLAAYFLLFIVSYLVVFLLYSCEIKETSKTAVLMALILLILDFLAASISKGVKIKPSSEKKINKNVIQYLSLILCLIGVLLILHIIKDAANDNASKIKQFKILQDEPDRIVLHETKEKYITCPYEIKSIKKTETITIEEDLDNNSSNVIDTKTNITKQETLILYTSEQETINKDNRKTKLIAIGKKDTLTIEKEKDFKETNSSQLEDSE